MRFLFIMILLGSLAATLSACNTTRGVGEDVSATGRAVQRAATP